MSGFVKVGGAACVTPHEGFYWTIDDCGVSLRQLCLMSNKIYIILWEMFGELDEFWDFLGEIM